MKRNTGEQAAGVRGSRLRRDLRREAPNYVMMAPYLLWLTFAGYLNFAVWRMN